MGSGRCEASLKPHDAWLTEAGFESKAPETPPPTHTHSSSSPMTACLPATRPVFPFQLSGSCTSADAPAGGRETTLGLVQ